MPIKHRIQALAPTKRPDGKPVVDTPPKRSSAEKKGLTIGDSVSYTYSDTNRMVFRGSGTARGFVHNGPRDSKDGDVLIDDTKRNIYVFVDSKNVFKKR